MFLVQPPSLLLSPCVLQLTVQLQDTGSQCVIKMLLLQVCLLAVTLGPRPCLTCFRLSRFGVALKLSLSVGRGFVGFPSSTAPCVIRSTWNRLIGTRHTLLALPVWYSVQYPARIVDLFGASREGACQAVHGCLTAKPMLLVQSSLA